MQEYHWSAFCFTSAVSRPLLHFFPTSRGVGAPYPVTARLGLFGNGESIRELSLEGLRLSQPDGMWVHDVFPEILEREGVLFGLRIALSCSQPRVDLSGSQVSVEISGKAFHLRYLAHHEEDDQRVEDGDEPEEIEHKEAFLLRDGSNAGSLVLVNSSEGPLDLQLPLQTGGKDGEPRTVTVQPNSVLEYSPETAEWDGRVSAKQMVSKPFAWPRKLSGFLMYKDQTSQVPYSVRAL